MLPFHSRFVPYNWLFSFYTTKIILYIDCYRELLNIICIQTVKYLSFYYDSSNDISCKFKL